MNLHKPLYLHKYTEHLFNKNAAMTLPKAEYTSRSPSSSIPVSLMTSSLLVPHKMHLLWSRRSALALARGWMGVNGCWVNESSSDLVSSSSVSLMNDEPPLSALPGLDGGLSEDAAIWELERNASR